MERYMLCAVTISLLFCGISAQPSCTNVPLKTEILADGSSNKYCEYVEHAGAKPLQLIEGSEFVTKTCRTCKCSATGLQCCQKPRAPTNVPASCKVLVDGCNYLVVSVSDFNKDCFTGLPISKKVAQTRTPIRSPSHSQTDTAALLGQLKKMLSKPSLNAMSLKRLNPEYEASPMAIYNFMTGQNSRPLLGRGYQGLPGMSQSVGLGMLGLSHLGESSGYSMFMDGMGPLEKMIMKDVMALENTGKNELGNAKSKLTEMFGTRTGSSGSSGMLENLMKNMKTKGQQMVGTGTSKNLGFKQLPSSNTVLKQSSATVNVVVPETGPTATSLTVPTTITPEINIGTTSLMDGTLTGTTGVGPTLGLGMGGIDSAVMVNVIPDGHGFTGTTSLMDFVNAGTHSSGMFDPVLGTTTPLPF